MKKVRGRPADHKSDIIADWLTGEMSKQEIADKYGVSRPSVHAYCKGIDQRNGQIVTKFIEATQELNQLPDNEQLAVSEIVRKKADFLCLFDGATKKNIKILTKKIDETISISDHRQAQVCIKEGKETIFGKAPDTAVQVNVSLADALRQ